MIFRRPILAEGRLKKEMVMYLAQIQGSSENPNTRKPLYGSAFMHHRLGKHFGRTHP